LDPTGHGTAALLRTVDNVESEFEHCHHRPIQRIFFTHLPSSDPDNGDRLDPDQQRVHERARLCTDTLTPSVRQRLLCGPASLSRQHQRDAAYMSLSSLLFPCSSRARLFPDLSLVPPLFIRVPSSPLRAAASPWTQNHLPRTGATLGRR
jgi:hypothetical protein